MGAWAVARHVARTGAALWWRKVVARIGRFGAILLVGVVPSAVVAFQVWTWGQVLPLVATLGESDRLAELAVPSLLLGFVLVCVILRAALLAFDFVATDLRLLLDTAPLTFPAKALVTVGPDFVVSAAVALAVGSVPLAAFASSSGRLAGGTVLALCVACVSLVGALTAVLELALASLTKDVSAARSGAAAGMLLVVCGALVLLTGQVQEHGLELPGVAALGRAVMGEQVVVAAAAAILGLAMLGLWGLAGGAVAREALRGHHRIPHAPVRGGGVGSVSAAFVRRDPANRVGAAALAVIAVLGVALDALVGLPVAWALIFVVGIVTASAASLYAYGEYLEVRWRMVASPAPLRGTLLRWIVGHWLAGVLSAALVAAPAVALALALGVPFAAESWGTAVTAAGLAVASGLIAGRLLPYERDDVFALAASGTASLVIFAAVWFPLSHLPPVAAAAATLVVLGVCLAVTVHLEPPAEAAG